MLADLIYYSTIILFFQSFLKQLFQIMVLVIVLMCSVKLPRFGPSLIPIHLLSFDHKRMLVSSIHLSNLFSCTKLSLLDLTAPLQVERCDDLLLSLPFVECKTLDNEATIFISRAVQIR